MALQFPLLPRDAIHDRVLGLIHVPLLRLPRHHHGNLRVPVLQGDQRQDA